MKFHSPVNGLSIKWCTCVSDWDAPREKFGALKKLEILKKLEKLIKLETLKKLEILKKKVGDVEGGRGKTETGSGRLAT